MTTEQSPPAQASDEPMRAAFEEYFSDNGQSKKAIETTFDGQYRLASAASAWRTWQACWPIAALKAQPAIDASTSRMALDALMEARQFIQYNKYAQIKVDSAIASLKAQPAPTEAQGGFLVRVTPTHPEYADVHPELALEDALRVVPHGWPDGFQFEVLEAQGDSNSPEIEGIAQPSGNTGELVQGEGSVRLDAQCYIVEADYHYEGSQPVRVFSEKVCAETFAAALNAYQESRPRTSWADAEHKQWAASHPAPMFVGADGFDVAEAPFGMPAIPAIPGTKGEDRPKQVFTDAQWKQMHDAAMELGRLGATAHASNMIEICAATITFAQDDAPTAQEIKP